MVGEPYRFLLNDQQRFHMICRSRLVRVHDFIDQSEVSLKVVLCGVVRSMAVKKGKVSNELESRGPTNPKYLFQINREELVSVSEKGSIYKFNIATNQWTTIPNHQNHGKRLFVTVEFSKQDKKLHYLAKINEPKKYRFIAHNLHNGKRQSNGIIDIENAQWNSKWAISGPMLIDNEIHVILTNRSKQTIHAVYNKRSGILINSAIIQNYEEGKFQVFDGDFWFVKEKRRRAKPELRHYSMKSRSWKVIHIKEMVNIDEKAFYGLSYFGGNLNDSILIKCLREAPLCTRDGRYTLFFDAGHMLVHDSTTCKAWQSAIHLPGSAAAIIDEAQMVASAYVNHAFAAPSYRNVKKLPIHVIELIGKWFVMEFVYRIRNRGIYKVSVDEVLVPAAKKKTSIQDDDDEADVDDYYR